MHLSSKLPEIIPAINNNTSAKDYSTQAVTTKEVKEGEAKCTRVPYFGGTALDFCGRP